jgi:hypothetical protein
VDNVIGTIIYLLSMLPLSIRLFYPSNNLKMYHIDQYCKLIEGILIYFLLDIFFYPVNVATVIVEYFMFRGVKRYDQIAKLERFFACYAELFGYVFPAVQAIIICLFKDFEYPLSSSSKLSYLKIISIN